MKKLLFIITLVIGITSCEVECMYCGGCGCDHCRPRNVEQPTHLRYTQDYFCADKLLGTWQMDYGCTVGNIELKEIKFFDGWQCDITMAQTRNPDWYTETWTYTYYGNTIKFARNDGRTVFSFTLTDYIFPELFLQDSFGRYTWRKVRAYGC